MTTTIDMFRISDKFSTLRLQNRNVTISHVTLVIAVLEVRLNGETAKRVKQSKNI